MPSNEPWLIATGALAWAVWMYLIAAHGRSWRADQRLGAGSGPPPLSWPSVVAVVPARDEADVVGQSIVSLLEQAYPGSFRIVLVDDASTDGTAQRAAEAAAVHAAGERLTVVATPPRPGGWVGKMWAVATGCRTAREIAPCADLVWITDADVVHHPGNLRRLVRHIVGGGYDLVSLMVLLEHRRGWPALLIPAFVYFFQQLYPFPRVNDPRARTAAAAGGCMLVRRAALDEAGGIEAIRDAVIDDCALARRIKRRGPIWLGLTRRERSIRPYAGLGAVWRMVARSAFSQLRLRADLLAVTVIGLALVYLAPPALAITWPLHGSAHAALLGALAWLTMAITFLPTLRLYGRSPALALALPVAAALYAGMTVDSARRHLLGRGAEWKGRVRAGR